MLASHNKTKRNDLLHDVVSLAGTALTLADVEKLMNENATLELRVAGMTARVADLEAVIKRLWQRGRMASPSPRDLKVACEKATSDVAHERAMAEDARQAAQRNLRDAMQARSSAFVTMQSLEDANARLESQRQAAGAWHASDAVELSRQMHLLKSQVVHEQAKVAFLQAELERHAAGRNEEVGGLTAQLIAARAAAAEDARWQDSQAAELRRLLEDTRNEAMALGVRSHEELMALRGEVARHEEQRAYDEQAHTQRAGMFDAQMRTLGDEAARLRSENEMVRAIAVQPAGSTRCGLPAPLPP